MDTHNLHLLNSIPTIQTTNSLLTFCEVHSFFVENLAWPDGIVYSPLSNGTPHAPEQGWIEQAEKQSYS